MGSRVRLVARRIFPEAFRDCFGTVSECGIVPDQRFRARLQQLGRIGGPGVCPDDECAGWDDLFYYEWERSARLRLRRGFSPGAALRYGPPAERLHRDQGANAGWI